MSNETIFYKDLKMLVEQTEIYLEHLKQISSRFYYRNYYLENKGTIGSKINKSVYKKLDKEVEIEFD